MTTTPRGLNGYQLARLPRPQSRIQDAATTASFSLHTALRMSLLVISLAGYLWSEVYSADMFQSVFKTDPMDTAAGARYRRHILASGGSKDAFEFLRDFLGREPSTTAFLHSKGLNAA